MMMSKLAQHTKIANGTKRAAGLMSQYLPHSPDNFLGVYSLRSEVARILWKCAAMARQIMVHIRTATAESEDLSVRSFAGSNQGYSPYTHTRTMLNTGGMRGREKSEAKKGRLAGGLVLERERDWALGLLCALVFEGLMAMAGQSEAMRTGSNAGASCVR